MPLPNASPREARVYALSKGKTLGTISGQLNPGEGNFPEIGNPITAEQLNEDELLRLVLVKIAAECIRADWVGLTS